MSKRKLNTSEGRSLRPVINARTLWSWAGSASGVGYPLIAFLLIYPVFIGYFQEPIPELALPINYHLYDFLGGLGAATGVFALRVITRKVSAGNRKTTIVVLGWFVAGLFGSLLQYSVASSAGPVPEIYQKLLPIGGLSFWTLSFCFTTFSSVLIQNRRTSRELSRAKSSLDFLRATLLQQVRDAQNQLQQRVQDSIDPIFISLANEIQKLTISSNENTKSSATDRLQHAAIELIRPLSHELYGIGPEVKAATGEIVSSHTSRLTIRELILRRMPLSVAFNPVLPAILIISFFGGSYWIAAGWIGFIEGCLATTAIVASLLTILNRSTRKIALVLPAVVVIGIVTGLGLSALYLLIPSFLGIGIPSDYQLFLAVGSGLVLVFTSIFSVFYDTRIFSLGRLKETNEENSALVSRLRQEVWLRQKQLAKVVHGGIQSKLNAARIRLTQSNSLTPDLIETVLADLETARREIANPPVPLSTAVTDQLEGLADFWKGVCEIHYSIEVDAVKSLAVDSSATQAVMEIVSEGISNSVKHSQAGRVGLQISNGVRRSLLIDLQHPSQDAKVNRDSNGLGTEILNQLTLSWSFEIKEGTARLQAEVPTTPQVT
jgi:hypothetical protein